MMKNKCRRAKLIFILILAVSLFASCTQIDTPGVEITIVEDEKPEAGGEISMGCVEPQSLNPIANKNKTYLDISKLLFESLFEYDENMKLTPVLAESFSFNNGVSQCIIKLKNGTRWSDGEPLTSKDVKFTMDNIKYSPDSIYKKNLEQIYSYQVVGNDSIKINYNYSVANPLDALTFPIIPEHIYGKNPNGIPVGTGKYKISEYSKAKNMELTINEMRQTTKMPYISKIKVVFINDMEAFSTAFKSKELDMLNTSEYDWEKYKEIQDVNTHKYETNNFDFISLNFKDQIFQDKAVRKAMMLGINRKQLIDKYLLSNATLADMPINPASWLYDGKASTYAYNKAEAKRILEEAGYGDANDDKILDKEVDKKRHSLRFTLVTNEDNVFRKAACQEIKKNLEEIGFYVDLQFVSFEDVKKLMQTKKHQAVLTGYNLSFDEDVSFLLASSQISGGKNYSSYSSPELDALLIQGQTTIDESQKKQIYIEIQTLLREEVPIISLHFREAALVTRAKIKGELKPDYINPYRNIEEWYVKKMNP